MKTPVHIQDEISRHAQDTLKPVDHSHESVLMALRYLKSNGYSALADILDQTARAGHIWVGPFEGFVAAVALRQGEEHIFLSNRYPDYNTAQEMMGSLVHVIGDLGEPSREEAVNEELCRQALSWYKINRPQPAISTTSVISTAVMKSKEESKNN